MMQERGIDVDHSTLNRWVIYYAPLLEKAFQKKKKRPGNRWRMDETYIKVKGQWKYLYRAVDSDGNTIDFLLTAKRDTKAALRFFKKSIGRNGKPSLINTDKSGANTAGIKRFNEEKNKRITRPMMGFKNFHAAQKTLAGIELMAMLKKGQMKKNLAGSLSPVEQFYALSA